MKRGGNFQVYMCYTCSRGYIKAFLHSKVYSADASLKCLTFNVQNDKLYAQSLTLESCFITPNC